MIATVAFWLLSGLAGQHPAKPNRVLAPGYGAVEGHVFDVGGRPVGDATVFAMPEARSGPGLRHDTRTDKLGAFRLDNVPQGPSQICATDDADFYPDTSATFYDSTVPYPSVRVRSGELVRGVIIRLGPQAGRVIGRVINADTRRPVMSGGLTFYEAGSSQIYMGTSIGRGGTFNVLVPSTKPFRMRVWARGYITWYYGKDGTEAGAEPMRVGAAMTRLLVIRLRPSTKANK